MRSAPLNSPKASRDITHLRMARALNCPPGMMRMTPWILLLTMSVAVTAMAKPRLLPDDVQADLRPSRPRSGHLTSGSVLVGVGTASILYSVAMGVITRPFSSHLPFFLSDAGIATVILAAAFGIVSLATGISLMVRRPPPAREYRALTGPELEARRRALDQTRRPQPNDETCTDDTPTQPSAPRPMREHTRGPLMPAPAAD